MTTPENNEPTEHGDDATVEKKLPKELDDFWKGYIGVVGGDNDPNYGKYRASASKHGEEYADLLMEQYRRQQEEFAKYLREKEQQAE